MISDTHSHVQDEWWLSDVYFELLVALMSWAMLARQDFDREALCAVLAQQLIRVGDLGVEDMESASAAWPRR